MMEEEAVSESGLHGFRRRWAGRSEQSAVLDDSDLQDLEDPLDVDRLIPELDLQDNRWEAEAFSDSKDGGSDQLENRSQHSAEFRICKLRPSLDLNHHHRARDMTGRV